MESQHDYLGQSFLDFAIRPVHLAYLFQAGSLTSASEAIEEATGRWGGVTELLLPYGEGDGEVEGLLLDAARLNPPDQFVFVGEPPDGELRQRLEAKVGAPIVPLEVVQAGPWAGLHQLSVTPLPEARSSTQSLAADASAPIIRQAACGIVSPEASKIWLRHQAPVKYVQNSVAAAQVQLSGGTALDGTRSQLDELPGGRWPTSTAIVWVSAEDSLQDAVSFWNRRALMLVSAMRPPSCLVTPEVLRDEGFREALELALRGQWWQEAEPDLFLLSDTVGRTELEELCAAAGWQIHREGGLKISLFGGGPREPKGPRKAAVRTDRFLWPSRERPVGQFVRLPVQLHRTGTLVFSDSPVKFTRRIQGPVYARFSGPFEFSLPPGSLSVGRLFHQNAVVAGGAVEILTAAQDRYEFQLAIPSRAQLLAASLLDAGVSIVASDKGLLAAGVAARLKDLEVLRGPLVLSCIEALTTHRIQYDAAEIRSQVADIGDASIAAVAAPLQNVRQISRPLRDIAAQCQVKVPLAARAMETLVSSGLAVRGLLATCSICGMSTFIELRDALPALACPGCGSPAAVATDPNRGEAELHYRLNSLVDRASDNGALVHLLAAAALRRKHPMAHVNPGVNLLSAGNQSEADILALVGPEIWLGEAKTSASGFTAEQIAQDVRLAVQVRAAHYILTCLKPVGSDARTTALRECRDVGIGLWVLEGHGGELEQVLS